MDSLADVAVVDVDVDVVTVVTEVEAVVGI